jgi:hypothetical protein
MQADCLAFVQKPETNEPSIGVIIALYCSFKGSKTVFNIFSENQNLFHDIDVRRYFRLNSRLIAFGLIHCIISRLHAYPILLNVNEKIPAEIMVRLNGRHHLDDICCAFNVGSKDLQDLLSSFNVQYILK